MDLVVQNRGKAALLGGFIDRISWAGNLIAGILMLLVSLSICYETSMRYFFDLPTEWVMSLSLLAFMWFPFLSAAYGIKEDKHICCDVFVSRAAPRTRVVLGVATDLTSLIYIVALGVYGYEAFMESYEMGSMSVGIIRYPLWILRVIFPIGMFLCLLQTLRKVAVRLTVLKRGLVEKGSGFSARSGLMLMLYLINLGAGIWVLTVHMPMGVLVLALTILLWGVPIAFGLGVVGLISLLFFHGSLSGLYTIPIVAEKTVHHYVLLAIPLFSLGGVILARSGLGEQIYDLSAKWFAWMPGGAWRGYVHHGRYSGSHDWILHGGYSHCNAGGHEAFAGPGL